MSYIQAPRGIFQGLALGKVCAQEDLTGPEVWGKEKVRRERETKGEEAALIKGSLRLYKLMRDVAETLKPSDPASYTQQTARRSYREKKTPCGQHTPRV